MHELVIRGGTIVDGTGRERFEGDVAIDAGRIAAVGSVAERGRRELDAKGHVVAPGWVDTEMSHGALSSAEGDTIRHAIPLGRPGTPGEIAGPIAFLASDMASYLHGQILSVNGGAVGSMPGSRSRRWRRR